jgi:hypothetical protein
LGQYTVGGTIFITGSNAKDNITVNLNGNSYTGNLFVSSGNGNDSISVVGSGAGSSIGGNVTLLHGTGNASVNLNTTNAPLTVGGSVLADNTALNSFSTFQLGNGTGVTNVGGAVTLDSFSDNGATPAVQIGAGQHDNISGALTVTSMTNNNVTVNLGAVVSLNSEDQGVTVGGLTVQAGSGNDSVNFRGASANDFNNGVASGVGTTINGDTNVNFGGGNDYFNVVGSRFENIGGQETQFNGNVTYDAGNGNDSINLAAPPAGSGLFMTIAGNLNINLGSGQNDFGDEATAGGGNGGLDFVGAQIEGNLNLLSGNGNNTMDFFGAQVNGMENFTFGNGNDGTPTAPLMIRSDPGKLNFRAGNGNDYLQLATPLVLNIPPVPLFNVNIQFGNGNDTFLLGYPPTPPPATITVAFPGENVNDQGGILTGIVSGGTGNNTFIQGSLWVLAPNGFSGSDG